MLTLFGRFRLEIGAVAGFEPGVVISMFLGLVLCGPVARRLHISRPMAWMLIVSLGVIIAATLTPTRDALLYGLAGPGTCDMSRIGLAPLRQYVHINDTFLNVVLFIPLGTLIGLLPRSAYRPVIVAGAILLPVFIETTQLIATPLGRGCQSADVSDNLTGLFLGLAAGVVLAAIARRWRQAPPLDRQAH